MNCLDGFLKITAITCVLICLQNLSVEAKVEATIQLEIDRLAAENLVRRGSFCHLKENASIICRTGS